VESEDYEEDNENKENTNINNNITDNNKNSSNSPIENLCTEITYILYFFTPISRVTFPFY